LISIHMVYLFLIFYIQLLCILIFQISLYKPDIWHFNISRK
jgi:hypothetical protein